MHFFAKIFGHIKKKQYLCTRFRSRKQFFTLVLSSSGLGQRPLTP